MRVRKEVIDWMISVATDFSIDTSVLQSSIMLFDTIISREGKNKINKPTAGACLYIMTKFLASEINFDDNNMVEKCYPEANKFYCKEFLQTEVDVLRSARGDMYFRDISSLAKSLYYAKNSASVVTKVCRLISYLSTELLYYKEYFAFDFDILAESLVNTIVNPETINSSSASLFVYHVWTRAGASNNYKRFNFPVYEGAVLVKPPECNPMVEFKTLKRMFNFDVGKNFPISNRNLYIESSDSYGASSYVGEGSYGMIYIGSTSLGERFVKKVGILREDKISADMLREFCALMVLSHPNIINLKGYRYNFKIDRFEIYMECMEKTLEKRINSSTPIPPQTIKSYILQLLKGLRYIHSRGFMHRDVSSTNIMVSGDLLKLIDFGLVRWKFNGDLTLQKYTNPVCNTYCRPIEIFLGKKSYNEKVDIWSAGCVLYYMLTKIYPFRIYDCDPKNTYIFEFLGLPEEDDPIKDLPEYENVLKKYQKTELIHRDIFMKAELNDYRDVLRKMFIYDPTKRISAHSAIKLIKKIKIK